MEYYGINFLQFKLAQKRIGVEKRYVFYEMKNLVRDFGISTPPELKHFNSVVGWCAKGVDALSDRLEFVRFDDDVFGFNEIFQQNNSDILFEAGFKGALIGSCSFIYISKNDAGYPRLQVIDGYDATGIIDPTTMMLNEGYAVLQRDQYGNPIREAYFTYEYTAFYENGSLTEWVRNDAPYPLLVPIVFKPDAKRPFGHSRISRACISIVGSALRTIKRSEISAEFYSFPQKWATGVDPDAAQIDKWTAAMSAMMRFTLNEDGTDHVKLGQFAQQSMTPHVEQLKMFASLFGGETGLTLDDLGFPQSNPSSYEAIQAAHENLRLTATKSQKYFNIGLINAGFLAACLRDNFKYERAQVLIEKPIWKPPFTADVSTLSGVGDALQKLNDSYPGYLTETKLLELTGI